MFEFRFHFLLILIMENIFLVWKLQEKIAFLLYIFYTVHLVFVNGGKMKIDLNFLKIFKRKYFFLSHSVLAKILFSFPISVLH